MSGAQSQTVVLTSGFNDGIIDSFGDGGTTDGGAVATRYPVPAGLASLPQSQWWVSQWIEASFDNPSYYTIDDTNIHDDLYGNPLYNFSSPNATGSMQIFQNTAALGGGYVVDLQDGGVAQANNPIGNEADFGLTAPLWNQSIANMNNVVTLSLSIKVNNSVNEVLNSAGQIAEQSAFIENTMGYGFTVEYNGAGGVGIRVGFVQGQLWDSGESASVNYNDMADNSFIATYTNSYDATLTSLPADANANPDQFSINVNKEVLQTIEGVYGKDSNYTSSQIADLTNLANWSIGSMYIGPATHTYDNFNMNTGLPVGASNMPDAVQNDSESIQLSNISLTENEGTNYVITPGSYQNNGANPNVEVDTNPQIAYVDYSTIYLSQIDGEADGGAYVGSNVAGIADQNLQYEYIYNDYDTITLTAPSTGNWYFGGGYGKDTLVAISGDNLLLGSADGATMTGGSGTDKFIIPLATTAFNNKNFTIENFKAGEAIYLPGANGSGWSYSWKPVYGGSIGDLNPTAWQLTATNGSLKETVLIDGQTMSNLSGYNVISQNGNLVIEDNTTTAAPALQISDAQTNNQWTWSLGAASGLAPSYGEVTEGNYFNYAGQTQIMGSYLYSGSGSFDAVIPQMENLEVGGGSGSDLLIASGGNNILVAGAKSSWLSGGDGKDTFVMQDANVTGTENWSTITNFHDGDTLNVTGMASGDWSYSWWNKLGTPGYEGATLLATSLTHPGLMELVTFTGLSLSDVAGLKLTSTSDGTLSISDVGGYSQDYIDAIDPISGSYTVVGNQGTGAVNGTANVFLSSTGKIDFIVPPDSGSWTVGGDSAQVIIAQNASDNTLIASSNGTWFDTSAAIGQNIFQIPELTENNSSAWDFISGFQLGDKIDLQGLSGSGWSAKFLDADQGPAGYQGLTLQVQGPGGVTETVTMLNYHASQAALFNVTQSNGDLIVSGG